MNLTKLVKTIVLLLLIGLCVFVVHKYRYLLLVSNNPVVVLTEKGFVPNKIYVKQGTKVKFKTELVDGFWPASNSHPNHGLYPQFDAMKTVEFGDEWSFVFDKPGEWPYHDHVRSRFTGLIIVLDEKGGLVEDLGCVDLSSLTYYQRQVCWYFEIKKELKKGLGAAIDKFEYLYQNEPSFSSGCHDAMHLLGDAVYDLYQDDRMVDFGKYTSYCGYGFYHGFIEAISFRGGGISEAKDFCSYLKDDTQKEVKSSTSYYSCFHGIGHATFDNHDLTIWGDEQKMVRKAIKVCEDLTESLDWEEKKQCVTGVYNSLGNAYSSNLYNLKLKKDNPYWFCDNEPKEYRPYCYIEVVMSWVSVQYGSDTYTFDQAYNEVKRVKYIDGRKAAMFSLASDYARHHIANLGFEKMAKLCSKVSYDLLPSCVEGVALSIFSWGEPNKEFEKVLDFCDLTNIIGQLGTKACYEFVLPRVGSFYSTEETEMFCSKVKNLDYKHLCG